MSDQPKTLEGSSDLEKFGSLAKLTHKQQAIWFMNGMWEKGCGEAQAESVWKNVALYNELDLKKKAEGCELDELNAHVFLEKNNEPMTVKQLRDKLREIGWEKRPMMFPLTVYLILKYKADWKYIVNSPQGGNDAEIERAQQMLHEAQEACDQAITAAEEAARAAKEAAAAAEVAANAAAEASRTAAIAEQKAEEARVAEAPLKAAEEEVKAALAEVQSQESARDNKTKDLQQKSEEGGAVSRNKAKAELAAHLAEDPLPLRKAKITLQAAERKAEKARAPFKIAREAAEAAAAEAEEARQEAESAANAAEAARQEAEASAAAAEAAVEEAQNRVAEAEAYLEEQKAKASSGQGLLWYMTRELEEMKKYMPASKLKKLA